MNRFNINLKMFCTLLFVVCTAELTAQTQDSIAQKSEMFVDLGTNSHGIVFDNSGRMLVGIGKKILSVTPDKKLSVFAELSDTTSKTRIWNMAVGVDGNIYCAANDRIYKITAEGMVSTFIKEDFPGEWGACDLKFDGAGNLFIV